MNKELKEKRNDLLTRAEEVLNGAKEEKRELTSEEITELNDIKSDIKKIDDTLAFETEFRSFDKQFEEKDDSTPEEKKKKMTPEEKTKETELQEVRAFENYIRGCVINERAGELTKSDNGAVIPTTIAKRIIKNVYDICPILEKSAKYNVKGNLDLPYYDTTDSNITVAYQTEFVAMSSSGGKFKTINLTGFLAGALSKISRSLINNTQFDIVNFVVNEMAYAIKRFIEGELLKGTKDKVEGLSKLTNTINSASATAITADEVIKLHDAIKDDFQSDAMWIMSSKTRTALRLLKDSNGRYLLQDDISQPFGTSLLGKPVYVSDNMADIGANNTAIYYGDMQGLATKFNEEINIEILREKYADEHAVGVIAWFEFDSKVQNAQSIARLVCAAANA